MGYIRQSDRTDIFLEHLMDKDLHIINDTDAVHTFVQGSLKVRQDLTLGGLEVCNKINNWYVDDRNYSFSDHRYIRYSLGYVVSTTRNYRFITKNKSFRRFNDRIRKEEANWLKELLKIRNVEYLDNHVDQFMKDLTEIADSCFRKVSLSLSQTSIYRKQ